MGHETFRKDILKGHQSLYKFITPEDPLVEAELIKVSWKDYGYDEGTNKILSIINYININYKLIPGLRLLLPRETIGLGFGDCKRTFLGVSMIIAAGIDEEDVFVAIGRTGEPTAYYTGRDYQTRKLNKVKLGHVWGLWKHKGQFYILEFYGSRPKLFLPLDTQSDEYYPSEYANRIKTIYVDYNKAN